MSKLNHFFALHFTSTKIYDSAIYIGFLIFVLSLPFGYSTMFLNIGMALVFFGWVARMVSERKLGWHHTPLDVPIALFLGLALVASLFAPHPATSSLGYFWKLLRAILLFYAVIHSRLGNRWRHLVISLIVVASVSSGFGIWSYINDTRLALDLMGHIGSEFQEEFSAAEGFSDELRTELRKINIPLSQTASISTLKDPDEWRVEDSPRNRRYTVRKDKTELKVYMIEQRLTGTFKMPNELGSYLALCLPFVIGYFIVSWRTLRKKKQAVWKIAALGAVVVVLTTNLALSLTRAAWVSVAIATLCICLYFVVRTLSEIKSVGVRWKFVLIGAALITSICGVSLFLMPQHIKARFQTMIEQPTGFMGERPQWWQTSLELIQKYPLTGVGLGRFRQEYELNGPPEQYSIPYHAHNVYLQTAVEHGVPSLFLFLWMIIIIGRRVFAIHSFIDSDDNFWIMGTFIGGSGFLISALIYGLADNIHHRTVLLFWFIIGIIFYIQLHKDEKHEEKLETD